MSQNAGTHVPARAHTPSLDLMNSSLASFSSVHLTCLLRCSLTTIEDKMNDGPGVAVFETLVTV